MHYISLHFTCTFEDGLLILITHVDATQVQTGTFVVVETLLHYHIISHASTSFT